MKRPLSRPSIDRIVDAVLYEGYVLYPYRPAVKNVRRRMFGTLLPRDYCEQVDPGERSAIRLECPLEGSDATEIAVEVRFLQPVERSLALVGADGAPHYVEEVEIDGVPHFAWDEAEEHRIAFPPADLASLVARPSRHVFGFPPVRRSTRLATETGIVDEVRSGHPLAGVVEIAAERARDGLYVLSVVVVNESPIDMSNCNSPLDAERRSFASAHLVAETTGGAFVSTTDPPAAAADVAAACRNEGVWPVLVGDEPDRTAILASPLILPDYPRTADESSGDFFDGTEIDEMLRLRVATLGDDEKRLMRSVDARARQLLERTESLDPGRTAALEGVWRQAVRSTGTQP